MKILITGGAGFIGSAAVRMAVEANHRVMNIDKLTYAGDLATVHSVADHRNYAFVRADVADRQSMMQVVKDFQPEWILHLAAETHVDRSIERPDEFVVTNVLGTTTLLDVAHSFWRNLDEHAKKRFRFVCVSTDEVFGSLGSTGFFNEESPYDPSSPYSASKSAADHLSLSWFRTYGFPVLVTNCSNNFGPFQHPEKLIPTVIRAATANQPIPIYGTGVNVRDWLYVDDHVKAIFAVAEKGSIGNRYCIGANCEKTNLQLATDICRILDDIYERVPESSFSNQITLVEDRPGHDLRYAVDSAKIKSDTGWSAEVGYQEALRRAVHWFLDNPDWQSKALGRIGLAKREGK